MRTNPNIITSGNQMAPPQLPDVNAMMQTRTAGMENIYALEQQRAAQQQTAQKEQEAEAMKALSPAIAAAFSDPSDAGLDAALALVPPQYQGAAKAQLDQIRALPDPNRRKDLIRAGLVQDEAGRTLLGQLEMTAAQRANFDVQREQNVLRREEIAQRRAEANQPEAKKTETAEEVKKRLADEKRVKDLGLAVSEIERAMTPGGLIDSATGGYLSNLYDTAAAVFSMGTDSSAALARLAPIADLALKMVPRFEGPQSNYDVQSYRDAAGNLANPNVPASTKRAAAEEIVRLFKKYKDQFEYAGDGAGGAPVPGVIDFNELGD